MKKMLLVILISLTMLMSVSMAQEISSFRNQKPFEFQSSIQVGSSLYKRNMGSLYSAPFSWYLNGQARFSFYGVQVPISVSIRNQVYNYTVPFSRFGMSPSYKWIKLYAGHNQLYYSPYTLAGVTFLGAGVDLKPGKFRFSLMSGAMQNPKAVVDSIAGISGWINPYKRRTMAAKIGVGTESNHVDLILLRGVDKLRLNDVPDSLYLPAASNAVFGLNSQWSLFKNRVRFQINAASSAFTRNQAAGAIETSKEAEQKWLGRAENIFTVNKSTRMNFAGDAALTFQFGSFQVGGRYQRIDPLFNSFGAYYFRDDNANYTINSALSTWHGKLSLSGSYGLQRNNLLNHRASTTYQKIHQYSLTFDPVDWFGINGQYSNFNFNQESGLITINDSLRFVNINANTSIMPYVHFSRGNLAHGIQLQYSDQSVKDLSGDAFDAGDAQIRTVNLSYQVRNKEQKYSINTALNFLQNVIYDQQSDRYGITIGGQKSWDNNKLSARLRINYSQNRFAGADDGNQYGISPGLVYKLNDKYTLTFQANYLSRNSIKNRSYKEIRANTQINIPIT